MPKTRKFTKTDSAEEASCSKKFSPLFYHGHLFPSPKTPKLTDRKTKAVCRAKKALSFPSISVSSTRPHSSHASRPLIPRFITHSFSITERQKMTDSISNLRAGRSIVCHEHLNAKFINKRKGFGICAKVPIEPKCWIGTYPGQLISEAEGLARNEIYGAQKLGCYLFYFDTFVTPAVLQHLKTRFKRNKITLCLDPTKFDHKEQNNMLALVNHSKKEPNIRREVVMSTNGIPFVCFFAASYIPLGAELYYDYGDNRKTTPVWYRKS